MSSTAIQAMLPYLDKVYGNPSSLYSLGQEAKEALEAARADVAACLGADAAAKATTRPYARRRTSARSRAKST